MKKIIKTFKRKIKTTITSESGQLSAAAWTLGSAVIVVIVIGAIMAISDSTATELFQRMINNITDTLGI
ncbi:hypothetical protein V6C27_13860 [Peptococcaceae bacterium 1198_IL3148]